MRKEIEQIIGQAIRYSQDVQLSNALSMKDAVDAILDEVNKFAVAHGIVEEDVPPELVEGLKDVVAGRVYTAEEVLKDPEELEGDDTNARIPVKLKKALDKLNTTLEDNTKVPDSKKKK